MSIDDCKASDPLYPKSHRYITIAPSPIIAAPHTPIQASALLKLPAPTNGMIVPLLDMLYPVGSTIADVPPPRLVAVPTNVPL